MSIAFTYDPVRKQAVSADPGIFVERINITKENVYGLCLNWHGKRAVINAQANVTGELPTTRHEWTITGIGCINARVPSYHFSSNAEINEAASLALAAMRVMPIWLIPGEQPTIAAEFSIDLKALLQAFPHYEPSTRQSGGVAHGTGGSARE